jgi:hypothetical protein
MTAHCRDLTSYYILHLLLLKEFLRLHFVRSRSSRECWRQLRGMENNLKPVAHASSWSSLGALRTRPVAGLTKRRLPTRGCMSATGSAPRLSRTETLGA